MAVRRSRRTSTSGTATDGVYSGFDGEQTRGETFLRGIQRSDESGRVTFKTTYPGWYYGRATHIHFQVFLDNGLVATSQVAFPESVTRDVYKTPLYATRGQNSSVESNATDFVFRSAGAPPRELCTLTPDPATGGYAAALNVGLLRDRYSREQSIVSAFPLLTYRCNCVTRGGTGRATVTGPAETKRRAR
jgi:hypothetical protein